MSIMASRSELGISPVLLQAIAQTLTSSGSSSSLTSPRETSATPDSQLASASVDSSIHRDNLTGGSTTLSVFNSQEGSLSSHDFSHQRGMDSNTTNNPNGPTSGGTVSDLLQNLNEPVASLMPNANTGPSSLSNSASSSYQHQTHSDDSRAVLTQAGLSMLGISTSSSSLTNVISGSGTGLESGMAFTGGGASSGGIAGAGRVSSPSSTASHQESGGQAGLSSDEMTNFLSLKEEPLEESLQRRQREGSSLTSSKADSPQNMNSVSSMLSALATQHAQESSSNSRKQQDGFEQLQQQQLQQPSMVITNPDAGTTMIAAPAASNSNTTITINAGAASNGDTSKTDTPRSQPGPIIIYSYVNSEGQEVAIPVTTSATASSSSTGQFVLNEVDGSLRPASGNVLDGPRTVAVSKPQAGSGSPATYRVLLQPQQGGSVVGEAGKQGQAGTVMLDMNSTQGAGTSTGVIASSSQSLPGVGGVVPITDAQNTLDGMSQPCPVCGDKVSGYHYGIFTCESCKGFFKRTVQNKKQFVCPKSSECVINPNNRKKCPACRFMRCLEMGMKLEAIRQDRTRGGRSSYEGCATHMKPRVSPLDKKIKRVTGLLPGEVPEPSSSQEEDDVSSKHSNLVAILNHNAHKQTSPSAGVPQIPELLRDIMNLEPLLSDDDLPTDAITESPFPEQAVYSYMMQLAELRLYKLVRWARNLPQFGAISTDDQILLLQNCWSELMALSLCWRSIDTPNQISISSTHHITAAWAHHLGFEDVVIQLISITDCFRRLFMDQFEYVALKVLLLITPDVKGLKEPRKIRDFQDKLLEALLTYTTSHYKNMGHKFGELLLRLPELSRISFLSKDILIKSLPASMASCGLLVELLKGDTKGEGGEAQGGLRF